MLIYGNFTTRSPLSHIGETISVGSLLNERQMIQENGEIISVFCYNANAWRGQLRDSMALYLIETLKIKDLSVEVHNFLFSGGKIGGASKFKLDEIRRYYTLLPPFSIFGGCLNNMMLPGKTSVFDILPICQEAIVELPKYTHNKAVERTYRSMTIERSFTRTDDSKNMALNKTLNSDSKEKKETVQMRMDSELLNSGIELHSRILINNVSDVEIGALCSGLVKFSTSPFIGGQHNKGHGKVDLIYFCNDELFFSVTDFEVKTSAYFDDCLLKYNKYIKENINKIKELLA
jgi:hypothetical protein